MVRLSEELSFRGLIHQVSDPEILAALDSKSLTAYIGFDPSSDSLHVGSLLQLCNLRRLQIAGHRPIALAGAGTGLIGDPGGKSEERPLLSAEELAANLEGVRPQMERFLDFSKSSRGNQAMLLNNADWLCNLELVEFLRDVGKHFTVSQMIAKESVKSRLERAEQGITYTEFSYMLLQAYDFLHLYDNFDCRLQLGGSDQWGNITMGVELIRKVRQGVAFGVTSPLVLKPDGTKFGKTESGAVYLDPRRTSPYAFYQYFVRVEDSVVGQYLRYFTFFGKETILSLDKATHERPKERQAQRELAKAVCVLVHGEAETARVEAAAAALYSEDLVGLDEATLLMVLDDAPSSKHARAALDDGLDVIDVLVSSGLVRSKSAARSALAQGGVYVNNRRVHSDDTLITRNELIADRYVVLRRGQRDVHLLSFS
jgi:tyrosyl-tRNA synthetase